MAGFYSPQAYSRNVTSALNKEIETFNKAANNALERFINSKNPWGHCFADPSTGTYIEACEYDGEDIEASILSKSTFYSLMSVIQKLVFEKNEELIPKMELSWCKCRSLSMPEEFVFKNSDFHFDIMNNSNAASNNDYRIGTMSMQKDMPLMFSSIRYTIGNFAPLPWWIDKTNGGFNLQGLHNSLAEWWDMLLLYLQWRMDEPADKKMSFVDYIIFTCQFFYIENLRKAGHDKDLFKGLYAGDITAEEFCNKIENDEECASGKPWTEHVRSWSEKLHKMDNVKILSLMNTKSRSRISALPEYPDKVKLKERDSQLFSHNYWEDTGHGLRDPEKVTPEKIHQTDELICRLIKVRSRCIMKLLEESKEMLGIK